MEDSTMYLTKCNYHPTLADYFNEVFERRADNDSEVFYKPAANIKEDEKGFEISLVLPGFDKNEISLKVEKETLTIMAGHEKQETENRKYSWAEFEDVAKYRRSFILSENVNVEGITAEFKNGILNISLPKVAEKQAETKEIVVS
jgi:HSP20 family protein